MAYKYIKIKYIAPCNYDIILIMLFPTKKFKVHKTVNL